MTKSTHNSDEQPPSEPAPLESAVLAAQFRGGDERAAEALFARYVGRLTGLVQRRMCLRLAARIDTDDVVMSAYRSLFLGLRGGRFTLAGGGDLWRLLVEITLHKLYRQAARHRAERRNMDREVAELVAETSAALSREPSPEEVASVADDLEHLLHELSQRERTVVEWRLQGESLEEIAVRLNCSERTVRRAMERAREVLQRRMTQVGMGCAQAIQNASSPPRRPRTSELTPDGTAEVAFTDLVLQRQVGEGAAGKVYQAVQKSIGELVAVKFLKKRYWQERRAIERFLAEATILRSLDHPGIVPLRGVGRTPGGGYFLTMEFIDGDDLATLMQQRKPSAAQIARWVLQVAEAIDFAHRRGIVHCDLKPGNVLISRAMTARVTDFGLAMRIVREPSDGPAIIGTPAFMAPEQASPAWGEISARTDVWGLGGLLRCLLLGHPPYVGESIGDILDRLTSPTPQVDFCEAAEETSAALMAICYVCLRKPQSERPASAQEVADLLSQWLTLQSRGEKI